MSALAEENFFPLKEKGKGSEYRQTQKQYTQKLQSMKKSMFRLRDEFGSQQFNASGNRLTLEISQAGAMQGCAYPQLRWVFYSDKSKNRLNVATPVVQVLANREKKKTQDLLQYLRALSITTHYEQFILFEKGRVVLNARAKVIQKSILCLNEILNGQQVERTLEVLMVPENEQLNLF